MSPVVSVIMANYGCAAYLPAAITSLQTQTLTEWELLLVDDASPDDSLEVAKRAAASDARIMLLGSETNRGPGAARNRALERACGEWVAIYDSDDLMEPERLQRLVDAAQESGADIVADNLLVFSGEKSRPYLNGELARAPRWIDLAGFIESNNLYSRVPDLGYLKPLIRRELIGETRYDEALRNGEDYDFLAQLLTKAGRMRLLPKPLYHYRVHARSTSQTLTATHLQRLMAANARFIAQHGGQQPAVDRALTRRSRMLQSLLAYDGVISDLKSADIVRGLGRALIKPRVWPLLSRPVKARARRALQALRLADAPAGNLL